MKTFRKNVSGRHETTEGPESISISSGRNLRTDTSCPHPRSSCYCVGGVERERERERDVEESWYGESVDFSILFYRDMIVRW